MLFLIINDVHLCKRVMLMISHNQNQQYLSLRLYTAKYHYATLYSYIFSQVQVFLELTNF